MAMLLTYQKKNGDLVEKIVNVSTQFKMGDHNGFGWKLIDKKFYYKKNVWLPEQEYDRLVERDWKRARFIYKFKIKFKKVIKEIFRTILAIIVYRIAKFIFYYI